MSGLRDIAKGGWHPKGKDGKSKESWRGDNKGINQIAGWMGKGKDSNPAEANDHVSRPLSTLKDPAAFGPPPKHIYYHGGIAAPDKITPDTRGLGAPLSREDIQEKEAEAKAQKNAEEVEKLRGPPVPYRADTTGLSTTRLPPPPGRKAKPPSLPPRLPPRQTGMSTSPSPSSSARNNPQSGILNPSSISNLSAAGVSVPGFGIGPKQSPTPNSTAPSVNSSQLNELQSRFSRLTPKSESPGQGTGFAEKQATLRTAVAFQKNPSEVSFTDAKAAAGTAINFRERHGDQVKSGWLSANRLNSKYGLSDKVGSFGAAPTTQPSTLDSSQSHTEDIGPPPAVSGKKKPPPPPAKRVELSMSNGALPPPIPMASKPAA